MTKSRQYFQLAVMGLAFSSCFAMPYIHYTLYDLVTGSMGVSNQQLGTFMTVYTICAMLTYIPAGALTDKFKPRYLIAISLVFLAVCNFLVIVNMSYVGGLIAWSVSGVFMAIFWIPTVKAIRETGAPKDQGKMFGCFAAATGIFSTVLGFTGAKLVAMSPDDLQGAFANLMCVQAAFSLTAAVAVFLVVRKHPDASGQDEGTKKLSMVDIKQAFKLKAVWLMTALIFCGYGIYLCIGYFTPYTTNVLGASIAMGGVIGSIRSFGLRIFMGPLSGWAADKMGSTAKLILGAFVIVACVTVIVLMLPPETPNSLVIFITLFFAAIGLVIYNTMFSCIEETGIPPEKTGIAAAVISLIGYTPDAIFPPFFGYLLDTFGKDGYTYIFMCAVALCVCGSFVCLTIIRNKRTVVSEQAVTAEVATA